MKKVKTKIDYGAILSKHGLSKTSFRMELLALFYSSNKSLSVDDVIHNSSNDINKVTVYRALEHFKETGLIHNVPGKNNLKRFSLCKEECTPHQHTHNHGHFICIECDQTYCLENMQMPKLAPLENFTIQQYQLTLEGVCKYCNSQKINISNASF